MSGEVDLGNDERIVVLLRALEGLAQRVDVREFAVIGGLAVLNALQGAHRVTNDIDTVAEQHGDDPTMVEIALRHRWAELEGIPKVDCIAVGDTPASAMSASDLPDDELDRAFVLAHRWAFDIARESTLTAGSGVGSPVQVTCRFAAPATLVAMKLQSAPRRRAERSHKGGGDLFDIFRMLSHPALVRPIAETFWMAPYDLGEWSVTQIRSRFVEGALTTAAAIARSGVAEGQVPTGERVRAAGEMLLAMWEGAA